MTKLAINGGKPEVKGMIKPYNSIGVREGDAAETCAYHDALSGYLGGQLRGGKYVCALEDAWSERFRVKHAIACNSATSGLLAAAFAVGLTRGDKFVVSPYTMSATAAAPMFTGAEPMFCDVEDDTFCLSAANVSATEPYKAIVATNLFGHPSQLLRLELECRIYRENCYLIEDNSQSPFAMENGKYAGTFGDIGVFSYNVHKHLQCGEGGICVTDNDELADKLRAFINHGEMAGGAIGLNLRLPEISAAIALAQLNRADELIGGRVEQARAIIDAIGDIPGLRPPVTREGCSHVYYTIPFLVENKRAEFVAALKAEGVPLCEGYVAPLYRLPAFAKYARPCPVAEGLHDRRLFYFENCAWSATKERSEQIGNAFKKVAEEIKL